MNLRNDSYVITIGTKNFAERYYRDRNGWVKESARGRRFRMTAEQVLNHLLPAMAGIKPNLILKVEHHDRGIENGDHSVMGESATGNERRFRQLEWEPIMKLRRIAIVVNGITRTPADWRKVASRLVFDKEYIDALHGLNRLERVWVIFGLDRIRGWSPMVRPRCAKDEHLVGIFASRGVQRPNKLGLTLVDLVGVRGNIVTVKGLDAFDGSPVYDIKNYDKDYDLPGKRP